jgi:hypothetical protein
MLIARRVGHELLSCLAQGGGMTQFVLLVTWFVFGQPPNSYQVTFSSQDACESARVALYQESMRLEDELAARNEAIRKSGSIIIMPGTPPRVSAVCSPL